MTRLRPVAGSVAAWTAGAVAAISVGLLALTLIGGGLTEDVVQPVTPNAVQVDQTPLVSPTASDAPTTPTPSPPATHLPSSSADRLLTTEGGTVVARCTGPSVYLVYWSPAQGYRVERVARGPAETARVTFEGNGQELHVSVTCVGGVPDATVRPDD